MVAAVSFSWSSLDTASPPDFLRGVKIHKINLLLINVIKLMSDYRLFIKINIDSSDTLTNE